MTKKRADRTLKKVISRNSYAKLNLYLEVLGKRDDGYHNVRTLFSEVELHDRITFALTKENTIKVWCDREFCPADQNIVYVVAALIKEKFQVDAGIEISIEKRIPIEAGLGGGSSNAACTILGLNDLWALDLNEQQLNSIAAQVGSDVNFFLHGGTALGEGRGELINPIRDIDYGMILLVKPDFGITSGKAYSMVEQFGDNHCWRDLIESGSPTNCFNRLEVALRNEFKELDAIIKNLESGGAIKAIVTGSGSTIVGFYNDKESFDNHYRHYKGKGVWCCQTKTKRRQT